MSLDQQKAREGDRIYDEFEPPSDWDHDDASETVILMIPGFKKEHLRVQVTSTRMLKVSGERHMNEKNWRRFRKEFSIPSHLDTSKIAAKFEGGILYVKLPKLINQPNIAPTPTQQQEPQKPQQQTIPQKPNTDHVSDQKKQQEPKKDIGEVTQKNYKGKAEESRDDESKKIEKRSVTSEMVSRQRQEYVNALCGLVDEVKKQKKLVNVLLLVFLVLMFGIYVKNVINSFFSGGHKHQEL